MKRSFFLWVIPVVLLAGGCGATGSEGTESAGSADSPEAEAALSAELASVASANAVIQSSFLSLYGKPGPTFVAGLSLPSCATGMSQTLIQGDGQADLAVSSCRTDVFKGVPGLGYLLQGVLTFSRWPLGGGRTLDGAVGFDLTLVFPPACLDPDAPESACTGIQSNVSLQVDGTETVLLISGGADLWYMRLLKGVSEGPWPVAKSIVRYNAVEMVRGDGMPFICTPAPNTDSSGSVLICKGPEESPTDGIEEEPPVIELPEACAGWPETPRDCTERAECLGFLAEHAACGEALAANGLTFTCYDNECSLITQSLLEALEAPPPEGEGLCSRSASPPDRCPLNPEMIGGTECPDDGYCQTLQYAVGWGQDTCFSCYVCSFVDSGACADCDACRAKFACLEGCCVWDPDGDGWQDNTAFGYDPRDTELPKNADNCGGIANSDQEDRDGDGVGDACDNCPDLANGYCGAPLSDRDMLWSQWDRDGDGSGNACDNCRLVSNADQKDLDGDGVGDKCQGEFDGDGRPDQNDNCPEAFNPAQEDGDEDGVGSACDNCPAVPNPGQEKTDSGPFDWGDACANDYDGDGFNDYPGFEPFTSPSPDNCILVVNPDQADGDFDGIGDSCDKCPSIFNPFQEDTDFDGLGNQCDPDVDGDGVPNDSDNCPFDYNPDQLDVCSGIDSDGDGVDDGMDNCPFLYNPDQTDDDYDGIGNVCEPDSDDDGLTDDFDNCPYAFNPDQSDGDFDKIGDACDNCPAVSNQDQADSDKNGIGDACEAPSCPLEAPACEDGQTGQDFCDAVGSDIGLGPSAIDCVQNCCGLVCLDSTDCDPYEEAFLIPLACGPAGICVLDGVVPPTK